MTIFTQAMEILTKIVSAWGMIWIVWGVITLAEGWNESNASDTKQGSKKMIGGVGILLASILLGQVSF